MSRIDTTTLRFYPLVDVVVVDHDPEMADFANPTGARHGFAGFVVAEDARGERCKLYIKTYQSESWANKDLSGWCRSLTRRYESGKLPVAFDTWQHLYAAYGSEAYSNEEALEWERSIEDDIR